MVKNQNSDVFLQKIMNNAQLYKDFLDWHKPAWQSVSNEIIKALENSEIESINKLPPNLVRKFYHHQDKEDFINSIKLTKRGNKAIESLELYRTQKPGLSTAEDYLRFIESNHRFPVSTHSNYEGNLVRRIYRFRNDADFLSTIKLNPLAEEILNRRNIDILNNVELKYGPKNTYQCNSINNKLS